MKTALISALTILCFGFAGLFLIVRMQNAAQGKELSKARQLIEALPSEAAVPTYLGTSHDKRSLATLSATALYVVDQETNVVLYQKAADESRYPASTTKLMTALVARDVYDLDTVLTVREEAFSEGTIVGFLLGEQLSVRDLLAGLLLQSGNDAAFVLANNAPGGYTAFVERMNRKAEVLGLQQTQFANPSGLDNPEQQTTAHDLALLTQAFLKDPILAELVATKELTIVDRSGLWKHPLLNRNLLLHTVPGVFGVKTGTTQGAGENLITGITQNGRKYLVIMLGSQARYIETQHLLQWLSEHYQWEVLHVEE